MIVSNVLWINHHIFIMQWTWSHHYHRNPLCSLRLQHIYRLIYQAGLSLRQSSMSSSLCQSNDFGLGNALSSLVVKRVVLNWEWATVPRWWLPLKWMGCLLKWWAPEQKTHSIRRQKDTGSQQISTAWSIINFFFFENGRRNKEGSKGVAGIFLVCHK